VRTKGRSPTRKPRLHEVALGLAFAGGVGVLALAPPLAGQDQAPAHAPSPTPAPAGTATIVASRITDVAPHGQAFTLRFGNRPIVLLRGRILGRTPAERATAAVHRLDELVADGVTGPVRRKFVEGLVVLTVGDHDAITILPTDVDELAGESLDAKSQEAEDNLRLALSEVVEARSPRELLRAALTALLATLVAFALSALLLWARRRAMDSALARLESGLRKQVRQLPSAELWRTAELRALALLRSLGRLVFVGLALVLVYVWLTFVLRQFPYTRPWGEALRGFILATLLRLTQGALAALPGLFTVAVIVVATRLLSRLARAVFASIEEGRLSLPGLHPDTAQPTRRLVVGLLWLFAIVVSYPYLPGSGSDAFKGVSVFVGLVVSFGSSGLVNQAMSSFMITYGRALRLGDFVRIGDVEGTVISSGLLATKIRTHRNEEVTLPNAVVASSTIVNFSRPAAEGVFARTSVTIGYDTPWRQVEAMLLMAAQRTSGVRKEAPPLVLQTGLQDFYVEYALLVGLERPSERLRVLNDLHGQIQDVFNEHGVQIMSPHYETDPAAAKVVAREGWFPPPARRPE
jgi:small-conductance mechanosensitive channel